MYQFKAAIIGHEWANNKNEMEVALDSYLNGIKSKHGENTTVFVLATPGFGEMVADKCDRYKIRYEVFLNYNKDSSWGEDHYPRADRIYSSSSESWLIDTFIDEASVVAAFWDEKSTNLASKVLQYMKDAHKTIKEPVKALFPMVYYDSQSN